MKKIILITFSFLLILSGCIKKSPEVTPVTTGLNFNAEISYLDNTYEYSVKIDENANLEMTDSSDNEIKYFFSGDKLTVSFGDISHETDISTLNNGLIIDLLYSVMNSIRKNGEDIISDGKNYYINGSTEKYKYTCFYGQTGLPIKITESNFAVTVIIKNAVITTG